ncbi:MAG: AbrB/MazE/SpoVT family DNA-binding domain-containing protein [Patescibacteria group bacterium]
MKAQVIQIGNSMGIRLPKALLQQAKIEREVKIALEKDGIKISPVKKVPRQGWREQAAKMHELGDDELIIDDGLDLDWEGWEW